MIKIEEALTRVVEHREIFYDEMLDLMRMMVEGELTSAQIAALIIGLRVKKETVGEIAAAADVLRSYSKKVPVTDPADLVDLVGTGGDGANTFNISTCAAFVAAAAGAKVAKHCGRGVSSNSGSADVLALLGISLDLTPEQVGFSIDQFGLGFMYAPNYHQAMRFAAPIRAELKIRTVFNILGPLLNPAGAARQLTGVFHPDLVGILVRVLERLGSTHALIVHGLEGLDEISITGPTMVAELQNGWIREYEIQPEQFGIPASENDMLHVENAAQSAAMVLSVLEGKKGVARNIVLLNAGATVFTSGQAGSIEEGVVQCAEAIDSGAAYRKLEALRAFSQAAVAQ